jgi:hypothetical protein
MNKKKLFFNKKNQNVGEKQDIEWATLGMNMLLNVLYQCYFSTQFLKMLLLCVPYWLFIIVIKWRKKLENL